MVYFESRNDTNEKKKKCGEAVKGEIMKLNRKEHNKTM